MTGPTWWTLAVVKLICGLTWVLTRLQRLADRRAARQRERS